ncbi:phosphatase PAP2 family protein [Pseudomonas nitroreducens]|uniref:phosphatase PAP2 family protein n=1 Tax=Pseudomonas nitroreducens TaxID=46680 RepID=UPI0020A1E471|nr:phosphatase PAP2 family protein [Pseudomonas nitroreducens]MCP1625753.1 undecaprenyl-diphosphatase [Pseudomonas nitroreducens]
MPSALSTVPSTQLEALNQSLFLAINATPDTPAGLIHLAQLVATVPLFLLPLTLLWLWCRGDSTRRDALLRAALVMAAGLTLAQVIGLLWPATRPFAMGLGHAWLNHAANASFPSDHMTLFACAALSLLCDGALVAGGLLALTGILVGLARVYLGIHFPLDLLGGCAVAAIANTLAWVGWARWGARCTQAAENLHRRWLAPLIRRGWVRA